MTFSKTLVGLAVATAFAAAHAAPVVYNGFTQNPTCSSGGGLGSNACSTLFAPSGAALAERNAFYSSLTAGVSTQDFESTPASTVPPLVLNFGFAGTATVTGLGSVLANDPVDVIPFGRFATSGTQYFSTSVGGTQTLEIGFSQKVAAFGFYGIDLGDVGGSVELDLFDGTTLVTSVTVQPSLGNGFFSELNGSMRFFGLAYTTNSFDRIRFNLTGNSGDPDVFAFDDLVVADAKQVLPPNRTPEPGSLALVGAALALAGAARRRRG
jgi:hypothetical protein